MKTVVLATNNPGKVREVRAILAGLPLCLKVPAELGIRAAVRETGETFEENAVLKALAYAAMAGKPAVADDSGLEVLALGGAPGVHSARYAGEEATDQERFEKLLLELSRAGTRDRRAVFRCVAALATPDGRVWIRSGELWGEIAPEPRGEGGFGYDPVFLVPELGRTLAELSTEEKNQLSHRGKAFRALAQLLADLIGRGEF
ncbi:MAG: non-canonical purine NTP pyrophosphatase [Chloroflexota bacterium]